MSIPSIIASKLGSFDHPVKSLLFNDIRILLWLDYGCHSLLEQLEYSNIVLASGYKGSFGNSLNLVVLLNIISHQLILHAHLFVHRGHPLILQRLILDSHLGKRWIRLIIEFVDY